MFDLLVIGEINPDLILGGGDVVPAFGQAEKLVDSALLTIGSSSVIMACGAARLGLSVAFMGLVGDDEFGRFMLAAMQVRGLDTRACVVSGAVSTGLSVILAQPHDRAILTYPGAIPLLSADHLDLSLLRQARHVHVGSYFLQDALRPDLPRLFAQARELGLSTSLDPNWDPAGTWDVGDILPHCDLFLPNQAELARISGSDDLTAGLDWFAARVPTLAVKLGKQGGAARQGGATVTAPALPVEVVDTTGAGDSFDAGFVAGYLRGYSLPDALALACACGSLSARGAGGTAAQPTLAEARAALLNKEPEA